MYVHCVYMNADVRNVVCLYVSLNVRQCVGTGSTAATAIIASMSKVIYMNGCYN